jgi:hypothetical protein
VLHLGGPEKLFIIICQCCITIQHYRFSLSIFLHSSFIQSSFMVGRRSLSPINFCVQKFWLVASWQLFALLSLCILSAASSVTPFLLYAVNFISSPTIYSLLCSEEFSYVVIISMACAHAESNRYSRDLH